MSKEEILYKIQFSDANMCNDLMGSVHESIAYEAMELYAKEVAIEFAKWMNEPMHIKKGNLSFDLRCIPQAPKYEVYMIIDNTGSNVLGRGKYATIEKVYELFLQSQKQ